MKKLINDPDAVVREALEGIEARPWRQGPRDPRSDGDRAGRRAGPGQGGHHLRRRLGPRADARRLRRPRDARRGVSRARSSPRRRPDQMLEATKAVDGGAGVLHIVKNYTGDVLNFEMAADLAKGEGIEVEAVVTNDDVAVQDSLYTAGRRGVGITVIAEKICGAAAEEGQSLAQVAELCRKVNGQGRSMGMALTPCITPGSGEPSFDAGRRRDGDRHRHPRRAGPPPRAARARRRRSSSAWRPRSSRTSRTSPATACSRSSTAWAARR